MKVDRTIRLSTNELGDIIHAVWQEAEAERHERGNPAAALNLQQLGERLQAAQRGDAEMYDALKEEVGY